MTTYIAEFLKDSGKFLYHKASNKGISNKEALKRNTASKLFFMKELQPKISSLVPEFTEQAIMRSFDKAANAFVKSIREGKQKPEDLQE